MPKSLCTYDCSNPPDSVSPYPDISGIGVVIGYIATAGLVVTIILLYYVLAYNPHRNPFQKEREAKVSDLDFKPNQFDVMLVESLAKVRGWVSGKEEEPLSDSETQEDKKLGKVQKLEQPLTKCVLAMSDLQILTGLSILISGFIQLPCGLQCYHWQLLVDIAWFSSLTHLACLTALRNYLYNRPGKRALRLLSMGALIVMLVVAIVPSANYNWNTHSSDRARPRPSDFAICYLGVKGSIDKLKIASITATLVLIVLGFLTRVVKLHRKLSVQYVGRLRKAISEHLRKVLRKNYQWCNVQESPNGMRRLLICRPLLAIFLALRIALDVWSSTFLEVWWLVAAFIWGTLKLITARSIADAGESDWTFGQIVPLVLLGAPILAVAEYLYPEEDAESSVQSSKTTTVQSQSNTPPRSPRQSATSTAVTTTSPLPNPPRTNEAPLQKLPPDTGSTHYGEGTSTHSQDEVHASSSYDDQTGTIQTDQIPAVPRIETLRMADSIHDIPVDGVPDYPDFKYYGTLWMQYLVWFLPWYLMGFSLAIIVFLGKTNITLTSLLEPGAQFWKWLPFSMSWSLVICILNSFHIQTLIESKAFKRRRWGHDLEGYLYFANYGCFMGAGPLLDGLGSDIPIFLIAGPGIYFLGCIAYKLCCRRLE